MNGYAHCQPARTCNRYFNADAKLLETAYKHPAETHAQHVLTSTSLPDVPIAHVPIFEQQNFARISLCDSQSCVQQKKFRYGFTFSFQS
jgi:hypothetical protein